MLSIALKKYKTPIMVTTIPGKGTLAETKAIIAELGLVEHTIDFIFPTGCDMDYMFLPMPEMGTDGNTIMHEPGFMNLLHKSNTAIIILGVDKISTTHMQGIFGCLYCGKDVNAKVIFIDYKNDDEYNIVDQYDRAFTNRLVIIDNK